MEDYIPILADDVERVFLIPPKFSELAERLIAISESLKDNPKQIALAFQDNLQSVLRTSSIPFQYTRAEVYRFHYNRLLTAERIRSLKIETDTDTDEVKRLRTIGPEQAALEKFRAFVLGDGERMMERETLERLAVTKSDSDSLEAARELTRQGVVLVWSAFEVLVRDLFVELLNSQPNRVEMLLNNPSNRKRFGIEKLDWNTLSSFGFNISRNLGTILAQRADLDDIPTIKDAYGGLFPAANELGTALADPRLWLLSQRRNLIVHRRGIVDNHYNNKTGESLPLGSQLWPTPGDVKSYLEAVIVAGAHLLTEIDGMGGNPE